MLILRSYNVVGKDVWNNKERIEILEDVILTACRIIFIPEICVEFKITQRLSKEKELYLKLKYQEIKWQKNKFT